MHKLFFYSVLKFIAFMWNLPPISYRSSLSSPHHQTRCLRSIKRLELWSMVGLLGKSMQNVSKTSLKISYTLSWVKSTATWHCRLIRRKMKWSFPKDCPCHVLTNPKITSSHSVIYNLNSYKLSLNSLWKGLLALGNTTPVRLV